MTMRLCLSYSRAAAMTMCVCVRVLAHGLVRRCLKQTGRMKHTKRMGKRQTSPSSNWTMVSPCSKGRRTRDTSPRFRVCTMISRDPICRMKPTTATSTRSNKPNQIIRHPKNFMVRVAQSESASGGPVSHLLPQTERSKQDQAHAQQWTSQADMEHIASLSFVCVRSSRRQNECVPSAMTAQEV